MASTLVLHDLSEKESSIYLPNESENIKYFAAPPKIQDCIGCFGCWIKTPGMCVIKDISNAFIKMIPEHDVFMVICKCVYGGLSPDVKIVLERSIGVLSPFFGVINGEMHHLRRHKKMPSLAYHFYGPDITEHEKETARKLTAANALNLHAPKHETTFHASLSEIKEMLS